MVKYLKYLDFFITFTVQYIYFMVIYGVCNAVDIKCRYLVLVSGYPPLIWKNYVFILKGPKLIRQWNQNHRQLQAISMLHQYLMGLIVWSVLFSFRQCFAYTIYYATIFAADWFNFTIALIPLSNHFLKPLGNAVCSLLAPGVISRTLILSILSPN